MNTLRLTFIALLLQSLFIAGTVQAAQQSVTPSEVIFDDVKANQEIEFQLVYTSDDINTAGISVKLYFDSSQLALIGSPTAVLATNKIAIDETAKSDSDNKDEDDKTDSFINAAWADFGSPSKWPGKTPADLYTVKFKTAANFKGPTTINLTGTAASGSTINLKNVTVTSAAGSGTDVAGESGEQPAPPPKKKKGGSLSLLLLMPLALLGLFRRRL